MIPRLYDELTLGQNYSYKYLGTLTNCLKCEVKEARNGAYTLTLETTVNDLCADQLLSQKIIGVKPNPFDDIQLFEVQKTSRDTSGIIKAEAKHIRNLCFQICTEGDLSSADNPQPLSGKTPKQAWDKLVADYLPSGVSMPFSFSSDINTTADVYIGNNEADSFGNILGGKEGSFLDLYGGEYKWDNFNISLLSARGSAKDYRIRYGTNISKAVQEENCESTFTHILPYGKVNRVASNSTTKINFFADRIQISNSQSVYEKTFLLDCTDFLDSYYVGPQGENYSTVQAAMVAYAASYAQLHNMGALAVNISVDLRATLDDMSQIGLCDTVKVVLDNFGTEATAKITEVTYDALLERWKKIVIGSPTITVADFILKKRR